MFISRITFSSSKLNRNGDKQPLAEVLKKKE